MTNELNDSLAGLAGVSDSISSDIFADVTNSALITFDDIRPALQGVAQIEDMVCAADVQMSGSGLKDFLRLLATSEESICFIRVISGRVYLSNPDSTKTVDGGDIVLTTLGEADDLYFHKTRIDLLCFTNKGLNKHLLSSLTNVFAAGTLKNRVVSLHVSSIFNSFAADGRLKNKRVWPNGEVLKYCLGWLRQHEDEGSWMNDLRDEVLNYIELNIQNPSLCGPDIIKKFRISKSYLYKIFPSAGGVQRYIRDRRLDIAFCELRKNPRIKLFDLLRGLGFSSERQFLTHFKARFDMSPHDVISHIVKG